MKRFRRHSIVVVLLCIFFLFGGLTGPDFFSSAPSQNSGFSAQAANSSGQPEQTLTIASFNIRVFGETKAKKAEVMEVLAKIVSQYDIVAVQEVHDPKDIVVKQLKALVETHGHKYATLVSPRLGRSPPREQSAFFYRPETVELLGSPSVFPEPQGTDLFAREPFMAHFKAKKGNFDFVLINLHTDPDTATEEIQALPAVLAQVRVVYPKEKDFIILGDLNADCHYYKETLPNPIPGTTWIIKNSEDTTVGRTDCTYDRMIITEACWEDLAGQAGVYNFDQEYGLSQVQALRSPTLTPFGGDFSPITIRTEVAGTRGVLLASTLSNGDSQSLHPIPRRAGDGWLLH